MRRGAILLTLVWATACSGGDDDDGNTMTPRDAGPMTMDRDGGTRDAGPPRDGGPTVCDPVQNSGCEAPNECLYHISLNAPQCRMPGTNGLGDECAVNAQDCPGGYTCLQLQDDPNPICRKVCRLSDGTGCEGLGGYECNLQIVGEDEFGWCVACAGTCDPLSPNCAMNQVCTLQGSCGTVCASAGSAPLNASCMNDACRAPGMCLRINEVNMGQPRCYEPCDLMNANCSTMGYQCADIGQGDWGVCIPM